MPLLPTLPSPEIPDARHRLLLAALIGLSALLCVCLIWTQPPEGTVSGICRDAATGQPLADADVSLSRNENDGSDEDTSTETTLLPPPGWTQDSQNDSDVSLAGADSSPRTEWETHTDSQGRFSLTHVRVGEYTLNASTEEHSSDGNHSVIVLEGRTTLVTLPLRQSDPHLNFNATTLDWTPEENPVLPLNGVLLTRSLQITLERLDTTGALLYKPSLMAQSISGNGDGNPPLWPGEFSPVRHWTYTISQADAEGSFYERIPLGPLPSGLYRVTAAAAEDGKCVSAVGWVRVSHLALIRKTYGDKVLAFVTDLTTGQPVANAALQLFDEDGVKSRLLSRTKTGPDGLARLSTAGAAAESQGILVAQAAGSTVALSFVLNTAQGNDETADEGDATPLAAAPDVPGRSLRAFLYTDRPVYRPGQTVSLKGISRWFDQGKGYVVPANRPLTLDIRDPQDNLLAHQELRTNGWGSWNTTVTISPEALTGEYTVKASLDGQHEQETFAVAAYQKPEYQATITFSRDRYVHGDTLEATVAATYYYGAPVAGAKATIRVFRGEAPDSEDQGASDSADTSGEPVKTLNVTLDGLGQTHLRLPTESGSVEGDQTYTVDVDIDDASGRYVSAEGQVIVAQGEFSLKAEPNLYACHKGDTVTVHVTALNAQNAPLVGQALEISAGYEAETPDGKQTFTLVKRLQALTAVTGEAEATVQATQNGDLTVRVTGKDKRGNTVTAETGIWVPGDGPDADLALPTKMSDLSLVLDRAKYAPGQTAHILINTAHPGPRALVTVEGTTLYRAFTVPLTRRSNAVDLPVTAEVAPSVTVKVCLVLGKQFLSSDKMLTVDDDRRALNVSISTDRQAYHPGDQATIIVRTRDAQGRPVPAEVSLGVVDSAIYAIQPEPPETIGDAFVPEQNNRVDTDYSCQTVTLGDVDKGSTNIDIRRKFPDTALWQPDIQTNAEGNASVHLTMPDTLTTWRITSIGHTRDTRVGKGIGSVTVGKDLLVRLETPPFLIAGDSARLIGLVHNNTAASVQATVHLSVPGLAVEGDAAQTVTVLPDQPARLTWTVTAPDSGTATGAVPVPAQLTAGAGTLSDGVEQPIPIQPHGVTQNIWHSGTLLYSVSESLPLDPQAMTGTSKLMVRLSSSISATLLPATVYLAEYPYESTDATAGALIADAALANTPGLSISPRERAKLQNVIARSTLRLTRLQDDDGGWGWFSTGKPDLWMTAWATWGLSQAQTEGFTVPGKVKSAALTETARLANDERGRRYPSESAISLASLALANGGDGKDALLNLRWLERRWRGQQELPAPADLSRAALAEWKLGGEKVGEAQSLMSRLWQVARQTGSLVSWAGLGHRDAVGAGTDLPDADATAYALLAALTITPTDPRIDGAARWLMTQRSGDHWDNPAPTAVVVQGLSTYMARSQETSPNFQAHVLLNGRLVRTITFTSKSLLEPEVALDIPGTALTSGDNTITLQKVGPGRLYYSLDLKQCLSQPAPEPPVPVLKRVWNAVFHPGATALPPAPSGYRIRRAYLRTSSRRNWLWEDSVPTPETVLNPGEGVLVRLIIDATRPGSRLIVEDRIPAGFRVTDASGTENADWSNWWDYTDVRDDKVVVFISDLTPGEHEIDYHLQAVTPGAYDTLPPQITSTADPTLSVLGKTAHLQVDAGD